MAEIMDLLFEKAESTSLVRCVVCHNSITGLTKEGIEDYHPKIDDAFPAHFSCYQDHLVDTSEFAEVLNRNRYKK